MDGGWMTADESKGRLLAVNLFIEVIATCGRRFFNFRDHDGNISKFEFDARNRLWFWDGWKGNRIYCHGNHTWRGFTGGGNLKCLTKRLGAFIRVDKQLHPSTFRGGHWAYGDDMEIVRKAAADLGITKED
jgi:hypothetical protein